MFKALSCLVLIFACVVGCGGAPSHSGGSAASSSDALSGATFLTVKRFILAKGDRQTFSNMYSHNPHYAFGGFDAFLIPDIGQQNIDCDPALSDFDGIVLRTNRLEGPVYDQVRLDRARGRIVVIEGNPERVKTLLARMRAVATAR